MKRQWRGIRFDAWLLSDERLHAAAAAAGVEADAVLMAFFRVLAYVDHADGRNFLSRAEIVARFVDVLIAAGLLAKRGTGLIVVQADRFLISEAERTACRQWDAGRKAKARKRKAEKLKQDADRARRYRQNKHTGASVTKSVTLRDASRDAGRDAASARHADASVTAEGDLTETSHISGVISALPNGAGVRTGHEKQADFVSSTESVLESVRTPPQKQRDAPDPASRVTSRTFERDATNGHAQNKPVSIGSIAAFATAAGVQYGKCVDEKSGGFFCPYPPRKEQDQAPIELPGSSGSFPLLGKEHARARATAGIEASTGHEQRAAKHRAPVHAGGNGKSPNGHGPVDADCFKRALVAEWLPWWREHGAGTNGTKTVSELSEAVKDSAARRCRELKAPEFDYAGAAGVAVTEILSAVGREQRRRGR